MDFMGFLKGGFHITYCCFIFAVATRPEGERRNVFKAICPRKTLVFIGYKLWPLYVRQRSGMP